MYKIYQDSILNFKETAFVSADVIVNQKEDSILYFTDGINAPKKLNATKAQRGGYPAEYSEGTDPGGSLTDDERLLFITTAKQPPLAPPTWQFYTDTSITFNNLYGQMSYYGRSASPVKDRLFSPRPEFRLSPLLLLYRSR